MVRIVVVKSVGKFFKQEVVSRSVVVMSAEKWLKGDCGQERV